MGLQHDSRVRDGDVAGFVDGAPNILIHPDSLRPDIYDVMPSWGHLMVKDGGVWPWVFNFVGREALFTIAPLLRQAKTAEEFEEVFEAHWGHEVGGVWGQTIHGNIIHIVEHSDEAEAFILGSPTTHRKRRRGRGHKMKLPSPSLYLMAESEPV